MCYSIHYSQVTNKAFRPICLLLQTHWCFDRLEYTCIALAYTYGPCLHLFLICRISTTYCKLIKLTYIVCFLTGVVDRLKYVRDVGCKILYINSMYESNDDDHMVVVDHRKIASVLGTMNDFNILLKFTKEMKSMWHWITALWGCITHNNSPIPSLTEKRIMCS